MVFSCWFCQYKISYVTVNECSGGIASTSKPTGIITCVTGEILLVSSTVTRQLCTESTYNTPSPEYSDVSKKPFINKFFCKAKQPRC